MNDWVRIGHLLLDRNPEATLWDLFRVMYEYKTGNKFPVNESDEQIQIIVSLHLDGFTPKKISELTKVFVENIVAYLKSMGFSPWRSCIKGAAIYHNYKYGEVPKKQFAKDFGISEYVVSKVIKEYENAERQFTGF